MILFATACIFVILTLSCCLNFYLYKELKNRPERPKAIELEEFLGDLNKDGWAMAAFERQPDGSLKAYRVDTDSILMRSSRTK